MTGKAVGGKGAKGAKGLAGKGTATKGDKKKPTSRSSKAGRSSIRMPSIAGRFLSPRGV